MKTLDLAHWILFSSILFLASGCSVIMPAPTPTATPTNTSTPTETFTPTVFVQATQTAQAQASGTAQAQADATRTAQAQASATARAQSTAAAQAAATATTQALAARLDAISNAAPGRPFASTEGKVDGQPAPYLTAFDTGLYVKNFDAQVELLNPSDRAIHTWDYGFSFRMANPNTYDLGISSEGAWILYLVQKGEADHVSGKTVASGAISNLDLSPNGSNAIRFFVQEGAAFLFVNGRFIAAMDVSELVSSGQLYVATAMMGRDNFPGLVLRYKNLSIKGLP